MNGRRLGAAATVLFLCFAAGGCMVASSKYELKTKEADALRDAVATVNKEKTVLEARTEALEKQVADGKAVEGELERRVQVQQEELQRMGEELASARKNYEGTRITREQLISELLEKEKATGKRIQSLTERAQAAESALDALRRETSVPGGFTDNEALKRERDILLGRVERLTEERAHEQRRRDERFTALSEEVGKIRGVSVTPLGPALRVVLPESVLLAKGKTVLSDGGKKTIALAGKAAGEFPTASILVSAGGKKIAGEIRAALAAAGKIPEERIHVKIYDKEKGAELLLLVP